MWLLRSTRNGIEPEEDGDCGKPLLTVDDFKNPRVLSRHNDRAKKVLVRSRFQRIGNVAKQILHVGLLPRIRALKGRDLDAIVCQHVGDALEVDANLVE